MQKLEVHPAYTFSSSFFMDSYCASFIIHSYYLLNA